MTVVDLNNIIFFITISALVSLVISFPIISLLYKFKIVRKIDKDFSALIEERRLKSGVPIMGGLIFVIAVLIINSIFNLNGTTKIPLLVFAISALLGAFDDILNIYGKERPVRSVYRTIKLAKVHKNPLKRLYYFISLPWAGYRWIFYLLGSNPGKGIQAHEKIIVQAIAGAAVAWWICNKAVWPHPTEVWFPFIENIDLGIFMFPFVILTVITMTNAVNISDGMDGLSAGLSFFAFLGFMIISLMSGNISIMLLCASVLGALLIYLYFNVPPARFQMGDVGSLALGTLLAAVAFALNREFLLTIFGFFFIAELLSTIIQGIARRVLGRRIFKMAPLHHHFELVGWPEHKVVMRFWVLAPFLILLGIWLSQF